MTLTSVVDGLLDFDEFEFTEWVRTMYPSLEFTEVSTKYPDGDVITRSAVSFSTEEEQMMFILKWP